MFVFKRDLGWPTSHNLTARDFAGLADLLRRIYFSVSQVKLADLATKNCHSKLDLEGQRGRPG